MHPLLALLGDALPALSGQTGSNALLLSGLGVLATVIVFMDRRAERERERAAAEIKALNDANGALRTEMLTHANAANAKLVESYVSFQAAKDALHDARRTDGITREEQMAHVVRQVTVALNSTGDTLDSVRESNEEMIRASERLHDEVRSSGVHKPIPKG